MVFAYYKRLTASQKRAYDKSDGVTSVRIPNASELHPLVNAIETALKNEDRKKIELLSHKIVSALTARIEVPAIRVKVLAVRPHDSGGELHGLYNPCTGKLPAIMNVWTRTAQQKRVVLLERFSGLSFMSFAIILIMNISGFHILFTRKDFTSANQAFSINLWISNK